MPTGRHSSGRSSRGRRPWSDETRSDHVAVNAQRDELPLPVTNALPSLARYAVGRCFVRKPSAASSADPTSESIAVLKISCANLPARAACRQRAAYTPVLEHPRHRGRAEGRCLLGQGLSEAGFVVDTAADGDAGLRARSEAGPLHVGELVTVGEAALWGAPRAP